MAKIVDLLIILINFTENIIIICKNFAFFCGNLPKTAVSGTRGYKRRFRFLSILIILTTSVIFRFRFHKKLLRIVGSSVSARIDQALLDSTLGQQTCCFFTSLPLLAFA